VSAGSASPSNRFERVVLPHLDAGYALARYLTSDTADAEDAVQEAVLRAIRYFDTLRSESDARAWFLAIVRRECYEANDERRSMSLIARYEDAPALRLLDPGPSPETDANRSLVQRRVLDAVAQLPTRLRETLMLRELQDCSYEEISTITGVPLGTVMSRLSRARARLAGALRDVVDIGEVS
jgi:RNA polymerase sigma-70 factor (ECF subfamily)